MMTVRLYSQRDVPYGLRHNDIPQYRIDLKIIIILENLHSHQNKHLENINAIRKYYLNNTRRKV